MYLMFQYLALLSLSLLVSNSLSYRGASKSILYSKGFFGRIYQTKNENVEPITVMINGLPGPMATEVAQVCTERGIEILNVGFTGNDNVGKEIVVNAKNRFSKVKLVKAPIIADKDDAGVELLCSLKRRFPNLVIIDYTHFTAAITNIKAYNLANIDFVMGTTGFDDSEAKALFTQENSNYAVIAPNMAKQIVAIQSALQQMSARFPGSFSDYKLSVIESHQSSKKDTSGTAKAIVSSLLSLNQQADFKVDNITKIRDPHQQIQHGVPPEHLEGHAFHRYVFTSSDGSVNFELQHNVCGRRVYAEGTVDAVRYLSYFRKGNELDRKMKRVHTMIDVLEAGLME